MKLKELEGHLGSLEQFPQPKIELEQYPTGPHIASRMLFTVNFFPFFIFLYAPLNFTAQVSFFCLIPSSFCSTC